MPVYYMWLNATCHSYLFETFELNTMMLPTVVFYLPEKNKHGHLIGKFDKDSISDHQSRFMSGKLPMFQTKKTSSEIEIQALKCSEVMPVSLGGENEMDDEIMQEILREDAERRKELEKADPNTKGKRIGKKRGRKGKGKKKGRKVKKGKGKKNNKKTEL